MLWIERQACARKCRPFMPDRYELQVLVAPPWKRIDASRQFAPQDEVVSLESPHPEEPAKRASRRMGRERGLQVIALQRREAVEADGGVGRRIRAGRQD